jgi:hypothetical protein
MNQIYLKVQNGILSLSKLLNFKSKKFTKSPFLSNPKYSIQKRIRITIFFSEQLMIFLFKNLKL